MERMGESRTQCVFSFVLIDGLNRKDEKERSCLRGWPDVALRKLTEDASLDANDVTNFNEMNAEMQPSIVTRDKS